MRLTSQPSAQARRNVAKKHGASPEEMIGRRLSPEKAKRLLANTKLRKARLIFANVGARALCPYLIGPPYVFAMDVPLEFTQDESGSASFGIRSNKGSARLPRIHWSKEAAGLSFAFPYLPIPRIKRTCSWIIATMVKAIIR